MKYHKVNKILITAVCLLAVVLSSGFRGCVSKKSALRSAIDASYRLPAATNDVIAKVAAARDQGIITPETSRSLGEKLNAVARAEVKFVEMVKVANAAFQANGVIDAITQGNLKAFFDSDIVTPFLDVLTIAKVITGPNAAALSLAVTAARLLIRTIANGIGSSKRSSLGSGMAFSILRPEVATL